MPPLPENPLPRCPANQACHRESRAFDLPPAALFAEAARCVRDTGHLSIGYPTEIERDGLVLHAHYRVVLFTDDLDLVVEPFEGGSVAHVRSVSRFGLVDLGVNRRRVRALFDAL